jgi:hypothetical protein
MLTGAGTGLARNHISLISLTIGSAIAGGCSKESPAIMDPRVESEWVAGRAAAALDDRGHFRFPSDAPEVGQVDASRADALGDAFEQTFGSFLVGTYDQDRGGSPIDIDGLTGCGRTYLAISPYADLPAGSPANVTRFVGTQWMVSLCNGPLPVISVAVSVYASDVQLQQRIIASQPAPNDFSDAAIPVGGSIPISPERAVQIAALATGRRITEVPELVLPSTPHAPQLARWRLILDRPVMVRGLQSGKLRASSELLVGFGSTDRTLAVGAENPDASPTLEVRSASSDGTVTATTLVRKPGYPLTFEEVQVQP